MVFRTAGPEHLQAIVALLVDDKLGVGREAAGVGLDSRYEDAYRAIEADSNQLLAVALDGDEVVGCFQLTFIPGLTRTGMWRGQIEGVRIAAGRRGEGLGQKMMAWAMERCRERGCGMVQLTTDKQRPEAHRFYERMGFVASHEGMKLVL